MLATPLLQMMCSIKFSPTNGMQRTLSMVMWLKTTMSRLHQRTTASTTACSFVINVCLSDDNVLSIFHSTDTTDCQQTISFSSNSINRGHASNISIYR